MKIKKTKIPTNPYKDLKEVFGLARELGVPVSDYYGKLVAKKPYQTIMASLIFYMKSSHRKHYIPENLVDFEWELFAQGAIDWFLADHSHLISSQGEDPGLYLQEFILRMKEKHDEA